MEEKKEGVYINGYVIEKYIVERGKGNQGVIVVIAKKHDQKIVIKYFEKSDIGEVNDFKKLLITQEAELLRYLDAEPNYAVRLIGPKIFGNYETLCQGKVIYCLPLEYLSKGTLFEFVINLLSKGRKLAEIESRNIFHRLLQAIDYLHGRGVIHMDIKLENIMFDEEDRLRLIDLGFSRREDPKTGRIGVALGTSRYMAPEVGAVTKDKPYAGRPADVFSLGIVLYTMHFGEYSFGKCDGTDESYIKIINEEYKEFWQDVETRTKIVASEELKNLIIGMIAYLPEQRLTIGEILNHPWIIKSMSKNEEISTLINLSRN